MSLGIVIGISVVCLLILLGLIGFLFYEMFRKKDEPENKIIANCYMKEYTHGHKELVIEKIESGTNRLKLTLSPRDVNFRSNEKLKEIPALYIKKSQLDLHARGKESDHRETADIFPPRAEEISQELKGTSKGDWIQKRVADNNAKDEEEGVLRKFITRQSGMVDKLALGIAEDTIEQMEESKKQLIKNMKQEPKSIVPHTKKSTST